MKEAPQGKEPEFDQDWIFEALCVGPKPVAGQPRRPRLQMSNLLHVSHPEACNSLVTTVLGLTALSNRERLVSAMLTFLGSMAWTGARPLSKGSTSFGTTTGGYTHRKWGRGCNIDALNEGAAEPCDRRTVVRAYVAASFRGGRFACAGCGWYGCAWSNWNRRTRSADNSATEVAMSAQLTVRCCGNGQHRTIRYARKIWH